MEIDMNKSANFNAAYVAIIRLGITEGTAKNVVARRLDTCEKVVELKQNGYDTDPSDVNLARLQAAREYLELAKINAPQGVWTCECGGSGTYYGAGSTVNGVFKGYVGTCFRCGGKGYQTKGDRRRNRYYDNHVRRIPA
jgi:hypothetical protein